MRSRSARWVWLMALALVACDDDGGSEGTVDAGVDAPTTWSAAAQGLNAALLSVHGTAADDVWVVGADDGLGPVVGHYDGGAWKRVPTGVRGDLWWVHALAGGPVFMAGSDGMVLRVDGEAVTRLETPALGKQIVYGVWGQSADDLWAVGSSAGRNGFIWRYDGSAWSEVPLPADVPLDANKDLPALYKVWGSAADDVWFVGSHGLVLHWDGATLRPVPSGTDARLFTVHGDAGRVFIVGGAGGGVLLEGDASGLSLRTPTGAQLLQGVCATNDGGAIAVGARGHVYAGRGGDWQRVSTGVDLTAESLHAAWVDPDGGVWAVGGNVLGPGLDGGVVLRGGPAVPALDVPGPDPDAPAMCPADAIDPEPHGSIARRWNEQLLNAVRRDIPRPGVHARNLFHVSVAMYDAWAAYDETADGYLVREKLTAQDVGAARDEAISYAALRVLHHRYDTAVGGPVSSTCFDAFMSSLGYDVDDTGAEGDSPRALGNRIAEAVIARYADDGANEAGNYADPDGYSAHNAPMTVDSPVVVVAEPARWQPLILAEAVTQNGIPQDAGVQPYIGSQWGGVTPFALKRTADGVPYFPDYAVPEFGGELAMQAIEVAQRTAELDHTDGVMIDISPGAFGNNSLGTDDGEGHETNPVTGQPYAPNVVPRGDLGRVLAEFWADGPSSETPPGHWNTLANTVTEHPDFEARWQGQGEPLDPLAWDVRMYLVLNGAVHDAAIAAWEQKRVHESARPITLLRYMASLGQRTDPNGPAYHADGIPLVEGLVEVITEASAAPGERHAHLARYVGEVAIKGWRGEPGDRDADVGGIAWLRGVEWLPYQRRNFVTPAFPGYVSGHSTFSRAAAQALTEITGSAYFPGGLGEFVARQDEYLFFERGPSVEVRLQWATYYDAADQAGQSRRWGGIHVFADDYDGRRIGDVVGRMAVEEAQPYFDGTAVE